MNWLDVYKSKMVSIDDAVSMIRSDNDIIVGQCASEPQGCMSRFHIVAEKVDRREGLLGSHPQAL